jgi:hypothetical protein
LPFWFFEVFLPLSYIVIIAGISAFVKGFVPEIAWVADNFLRGGACPSAASALPTFPLGTI